MSLVFKEPRLQDEWAQLATKNPKLHDLVIDLTQYVADMLKKDVVLTSIYRTAEEQAALYAVSLHKVLDSPHMHWNAVDLRSTVYTEDEIRGIINYINAWYKNANGKPVVIYHVVPGNAYHFHIQRFS